MPETRMLLDPDTPAEGLLIFPLKRKPRWSIADELRRSSVTRRRETSLAYPPRDLSALYCNYIGSNGVAALTYSVNSEKIAFSC